MRGKSKDMVDRLVRGDGRRQSRGNVALATELAGKSPETRRRKGICTAELGGLSARSSASNRRQVDEQKRLHSEAPLPERLARGRAAGRKAGTLGL